MLAIRKIRKEAKNVESAVDRAPSDPSAAPPACTRSSSPALDVARADLGAGCGRVLPPVLPSATGTRVPDMRPKNRAESAARFDRFHPIFSRSGLSLSTNAWYSRREDRYGHTSAARLASGYALDKNTRPSLPRSRTVVLSVSNLVASMPGICEGSSRNQHHRSRALRSSPDASGSFYHRSRDEKGCGIFSAALSLAGAGNGI